MSVKILHTADFHLDSPFDALSTEMATTRRREQRDLLDRIARLAEENQVQLVLISGDLLDSATSYYETQEVLHRAFSKISAEIFISPGNHDFFCPRSPYSYVNFPDNVHIFSSPRIESFALPQLGCRVWGAGFNDPYSKPLLSGFHNTESDLIDIMVMHGDMCGDSYNRLREAEIATSGLDYLALGHIHSFSGIKQAGKTHYAYPGCPEGRGFDETGDKGVILGSVWKSGCDLRFTPLGGRAYRIQNVDLTASEDPLTAITSSLPHNTERDIYRINLTGEYGETIDISALKDRLAERFFQLSLQDMTRLPRDIWSYSGDDTLRGIFISRLKKKYDTASDLEKSTILSAVRYGLSALENREEFEA